MLFFTLARNGKSTYGRRSSGFNIVTGSASFYECKSNSMTFLYKSLPALLQVVRLMA